MPIPLCTAALLLFLAPCAAGCAGAGGSGGGGPAEASSARGRGARPDPAARRREAEAEAARAAEKRSQLARRGGPDRRVEASALSEEELGEFRRGWRFFLEHD